MIIYLLTGRPDARKTHTQPGRPDFFFVAWNSLKYGENSYCIAYFNEFYPTFSQNRVKIGVLNSFSSLKLHNPRPGGGGRGYSHIRTVRVCAARKHPTAPRPPPHFWTWLLFCFDVGHSKRPPFQKYTILCSVFPTWADRKDRPFKKIYVSLLFLTPKSPVFPVRGRSESNPPPSPEFSVRGRSLSPPFLNNARQIYTNFIFEYPPRPHPHTHPGSKTIALKIVLAKC